MFQMKLVASGLPPACFYWLHHPSPFVSIYIYAETYSIARHSKVFTAKDLDIRLVDAFPSKCGQRYFRLFAHLCGCDQHWKRVVMMSKGLVMVMVMVLVLVTMLKPSLPRSYRHLSPRHLAENVVRNKKNRKLFFPF